MPILSNAQITLARTTLETSFPDTCNILSVTLTSDGQGGNTEAWGTATASVSCRLDPVPGLVGRESMTGQASQDYKVYILTVPHSTTITEAHRIEVNSNTFSVTSVDRAKSWALDRRAIVERI